MRLLYRKKKIVEASLMLDLHRGLVLAELTNRIFGGYLTFKIKRLHVHIRWTFTIIKSRWYAFFIYAENHLRKLASLSPRNIYAWSNYKSSALMHSGVVFSLEIWSIQFKILGGLLDDKDPDINWTFVFQNSSVWNGAFIGVIILKAIF